MRKVICVVAVLGLAVACAAPAQAATHDIDSTIRLAHVEETGSPPVSGSAEYAGTFKGALGSGAIIGQLSYAVPDFQGTFRVYLNKGTLRAPWRAAPRRLPAEASPFPAVARSRRAPGSTRAPHGEFTFTGTQAADPPVATLAITGSVKY